MKIFLIILGILILMGPIMWGFAKLNKVDPFILDREHPEEDERSLICVVVLRPLFAPLWLEKRLIDWFKKDSN